MQFRTMILTALVGGPLIGVLLGLAIDPTMKPRPEPAWRGIAPDPIFAEPRRIFASGPQDLSPTWHLDRMPTWKQRAAARQAAMRDAAVHRAMEAGYPGPEMETVDDRPAFTAVRGGATAEIHGRRPPNPLDEAAEQAGVASRQAGTAIAQVRPAGRSGRYDGGLHDGGLHDDGLQDTREAIVVIPPTEQEGAWSRSVSN